MDRMLSREGRRNQDASRTPSFNRLRRFRRGRPGAGAPPASPGGPRPRTARTLRELPGEPGAPPCDCGPTCRERRACCAGTPEKAADAPANGRARATRGCPTSRKIKRIERGMALDCEPRTQPVHDAGRDGQQELPGLPAARDIMIGIHSDQSGGQLQAWLEVRDGGNTELAFDCKASRAQRTTGELMYMASTHSTTTSMHPATRSALKPCNGVEETRASEVGAIITLNEQMPGLVEFRPTAPTSTVRSAAPVTLQETRQGFPDWTDARPPE